MHKNSLKLSKTLKKSEIRDFVQVFVILSCTPYPQIWPIIMKNDIFSVTRICRFFFSASASVDGKLWLGQGGSRKFAENGSKMGQKWVKNGPFWPFWHVGPKIMRISKWQKRSKFPPGWTLLLIKQPKKKFFFVKNSSLKGECTFRGSGQTHQLGKKSTIVLFEQIPNFGARKKNFPLELRVDIRWY